ncbi:MAG TPA: glycosyltransferase, partial [Rubrobacter sp.]|nr:glycosyltransferase [Rubrobacter sp.]
MVEKVSIVIPTFNAGPGFEELLRKLDAQEGDFEQEVVVVDSGSTDGTVELAARHGAILHSVSKASFDHGVTRDLGISLSSGEYVALTVQDAVPLDERWLAAMVENLQNDGRLAAVYGRHVPRPDASVITRALIGNLAVSDTERQEQEIRDKAQYLQLPPAQRRRIASFDNVSSCLRRQVWEEFPFGEADFAEDLRWGKKVVEAGYTIVYEPRSVVVHSHERGALYDFRRHYVDQRVLDELFGASLVPNLPRLILGIPYATIHVYSLLRREEPAPEKRPKLLFEAATYALASQLGAYLGCKVHSLS